MVCKITQIRWCSERKLPLVLGNVNGQLVDIMLDTGAPITIISEASSLSSVNIDLVALSADSVHHLGVTAALCVGNNTINMSTMVVQNLEYDILVAGFPKQKWNNNRYKKCIL